MSELFGPVLEPARRWAELALPDDVPEVRAVEVTRVVREVLGVRAADVATLLGCSRTRVISAARLSAQELDTLLDVERRLGPLVTRWGAARTGAWLRGEQRYLGARPVELLGVRAGAARVSALIDAVVAS